MQKNVGNLDKIIRVVIGLALISSFFILESNMRYFGLIGIIPLATAALGSCPLYTLFGIKTCPMAPLKK